MPYHRRTITVIIPAFNQVDSIAGVVLNLCAPENQNRPLVDEVLLCDNGSTDATAEQARSAGAEVCSEFRRGYGYACLRAMRAIKYSARKNPDYVVFVDGDHSATVSELPRLLQALANGCDRVVACPTAESRHARATSLGYRLASCRSLTEPRLALN